MNELIEKFNGYELTCIMSEDGEDFFLDTESIANVLGRSVRTIERHIGDVLDDMDERQKMSFVSIVPDSVGRMQKRVYSSEVFIEVAYKVKSQQAREFRNWANKILKRELMKPFKNNTRLIGELEERNTELQSQVRTTSEINLQMTNSLSRVTEALEYYEREVKRLRPYEDKYKHRRTKEPEEVVVKVHMTLDEFMNLGGDINEL